MGYYSSFTEAIQQAKDHLLTYGEDVDAGRWQGVETEGKPDLITRELMNFTLSVPIDQRPKGKQFDEDAVLPYLADQIKPNLPWADDHFDERVSRKPSNPGEAYKTWPWWRGQYEETAHAAEDEFRFTHTYQERFWPKFAGYEEDSAVWSNMGIRYPYGDLDDVVNLLYREPNTRQGYFPIFFPEDTGAVHGGRIPCTLGYQFLVRNEQLHMWYFIRSCDYVRHFRDDIYLACRLNLWVLSELCERDLRDTQEQGWFDITPGLLHMTICSLHVHKGDEHLARQSGSAPGVSQDEDVPGDSEHAGPARHLR